MPDGLSDDVEKLVSDGSLVGPSDIPAFVDAIRNLNGVGINDREGLVHIYILHF
jgi:linoleate 10R-lipoxygenase